MARCMRLIVNKHAPPERCDFRGDETKMHYAMCYNPDPSVLKDVVQVWLCPPCAAILTAELMGAEMNRRNEMERNRRTIKESASGDPDAIRTRQFLARRNQELKGVVQRERNRMCRWCEGVLNIKKEEAARDAALGTMTKYGRYGLQKGTGFAHADLHAPHGFGRAWLMFHTGCMAEWMEMRLRGVVGVRRAAEPPTRAEIAVGAAVRGTAQRTLEEAVPA